MSATSNQETINPLWYKDAVIYQVHVRSFYDSNGDGIGDFRGLIQKLDYIQSLGVNTLWLLPFYPSPLKDGGYDIADFGNIHPDYGTLADFKKFVKEAHRRGLRIITELVLNHTSTDHKWFQRARRSKPGSVYRDFYVWNKDTDKYKDARIIFQDFEVSNWTYDHVAQAYYWHRFYSHQPDLNFENPRVQSEVFKILDFWFEMGVDGFRLDAVPYLYEAEGTNCENLPETHEFLKKLRKYVDDNYIGKLLLAEANQWPNDSRAYFGDGDECHMAFHFPLMPRMYMALRMEDRFPIVDIMEQTPEIPDNCQWAIFLRNHDELTLEMVSDEERDYMYKTFAKDPRKRVNVGIRRRLFPLLGGDTRTIELLNFLLFSMPGTPIVYYGDEIGMGDNYYLGDRDGVRTPMQWSPDKNAGFSQADPQKLFLPVVIDNNYHYTTVNVENHEKNPSSFLWWIRRVIAKRKRYTAFGRGTIRFINSSNPKVLSFVRETDDESILVIVNLSRYSQHVEIDLSEYAGCIPMEVFSRNEFPVITDKPWPFSMQFKNYFWFELQKTGQALAPVKADNDIVIDSSQWKKMEPWLLDKVKGHINQFIVNNKWYQGNPRKIRDIHVDDVFTLQGRRDLWQVLLVQLDLIEEEKSTFLMPLGVAVNNKMNEIRTIHPESVIAGIRFSAEDAILYDAVHDPQLVAELFDAVKKKSRIKGRFGEIEGSSGSLLKKSDPGESSLKQHLGAYKPSNTSILLGDKYFFKLYRNPQEGENPDVEIVKNLTRHSALDKIPPYLGRLDYRKEGIENTSLAMVTEFVPNVESTWEMTKTSIESFFDKVLSEKPSEIKVKMQNASEMEDLVGPFFLEMMNLMGQRTAGLHMAMAEITEVGGFKPEPFSLLYQKSLYQAMRTLVKRNFSWISQRMESFEEDVREKLQVVIDSHDVYFSYILKVLEKGKIEASKTRIHGNYKLDKLLFTGKDFMITDFEGEAEFPISVRKIKHCPLKDVASMLGSLRFAISQAHFVRREFVPDDDNFLPSLIDQWYETVADHFVNGYVEIAGKSGLIPGDRAAINELLTIFSFERAVTELRKLAEKDPISLEVPVSILLGIRDKI